MDYTIKLNANASTPVQTGYTLKAGDKGQRLHFKVEGITTTSSVQIAFLRPTGTSVVSTDVTNLGNGEYEYVFKGNEIEFPGIVCADLKFYETNRRESTASFVFSVTGDTINGIAGPTGAYSDQLEELTTELQNTLDAYTQAFGTVGVMRPRGNYNNSVQYAKFDLVYYNGSSWLALNSTVGHAPADGSTYWQRYNSADADTLDGYHANELAYSENLLDNAWFTVNQREGKIAPYGTNYYSDESCTIFAFVAVSYENVTLHSNGNYKYLGSNGVWYYVKASDVVDGYAGNYIYTADRWLTGTPIYVKTFPLGGIELRADNGAWALTQAVDLSKRNLDGETVTFSIDVAQIKEATGDEWRIFLSYGASESDMAYAILDFDTAGIHSQTITLPSNVKAMRYGIQRVGTYQAPSTIKINSVKLEVGSVCTITKDTQPNYALELVKCQRYYQIIKTMFYAYNTADERLRGSILFPTPMRTTPAIQYEAGGIEFTMVADTQGVTFYSDVTSIYKWATINRLVASADL